MKKFIKKCIRDIGYFIRKAKYLPVGTDLFEDLKFKVNYKIKAIFDVGANVGKTAIDFNTNLKAKVLCFEPVKSTYEKLLLNTANSKDIVCYQIALGDKCDNRNINIFEEKFSFLNSLNFDSMNLDPSAINEIIKIETGDTFCTKMKISNIDLLKIDTEGYEYECLKGFSGMLSESRIKMVYCEVGFNKNDNRHSYFEKINSFLYDYGFVFYGLYEICNSINDGNSYANALYIIHKENR